MSTSSDTRTDAVLAFITNEHFRFRGQPGACAAEGEVVLDDAWLLECTALETPLVQRMMEDFREFCRQCFGVTLGAGSDASKVTHAPRIIWSLLPDADGAGLLDLQSPQDPQAPEGEAFEIVIRPGCVEIRAHYERGLLQGTHRLEWMMVDRGGPWLAPGTKPFRPAFMPRISNGVFIPGHQGLLAPGQFPDAYLGLMSHYGVNGIHLYVDLWSLFKSKRLPELESSDFESQVKALRELNARTLAYGIDLYLHLNTPPLDGSHPVFVNHPELRGAKVEIFIEELSGRSWYNVCSGSETAHAAYAEAVETLFAAAPEVAGAMMIIGGECFYHCFTRPAGSKGGETNCPRCRGRNPSSEVARLVNTVARAVKKTGAHKSFYAWPYSAFVWSAGDEAQRGWISQLDPEVSVLSNFDAGDAVDNGSGVRCFDYNISQIGPSSTFASQAAALRKKGRPIFTKTETNTTPEAFFLPYLPVHQRWLARFQAMQASGVAGFVGQWRFFGMNGSLPEELQYRVTWDGNGDGKAWLKMIAQRDFHLTAAGACTVVEGWRLLSEAWESFPYSAMTCGERAAYMRGPFYLGPSHPLILDVQSSYDLPLSFRLLRGDVAELVSPDELAEVERRSKPRYVSDLLVTLPYGVERYLELLGECRAKWERGLALLREQLEGRGRIDSEGNGGRAQRELDICSAIGSHLATLENVVLFYRERDRLQGSILTAEEFDHGVTRLQEIASDEIRNAEAILPALERDPRIGYGHCYGPVYDVSMVRAKIAQCQYVRDVELPRYASVIRFHIWLQN